MLYPCIIGVSLYAYEAESNTISVIMDDASVGAVENGLAISVEVNELVLLEYKRNLASA